MKKDYGKAIRYYKKASAMNWPAAKHHLGYLYEHGLGLPTDKKKAFSLYLSAAKKGYIRAQYNVGSCYYNGVGIDKSYHSSAQWFDLAAKQGYAKAQFFLALQYWNGRGVMKNRAQAVTWFKKYTAQRSPQEEKSFIPGFGVLAERRSYAFEKLALAYQFGLGVKITYRQAAYYYKQAVRGNNKKAQYNLAYLYSTGRGVKQSTARAIYWYQQAKDNGFLKAYEALARLYFFDKRAPKKYKEAVKLCKKIAKSSAQAQAMLGYAYQFGKGTDKNIPRAIYWYRKAAQEKNPVSMYALGVIYQKGIGVKKNIKQAIVWYKQAAKKDHRLAKRKLKQLSKNRKGVMR